MEIWTVIAGLEGQTLKTLDRGRPFDIVRVGPRAVIVRLHSTGRERRVERDDVESAFDELRQRGQLTPTDIHERHSAVDPAYVAAMLAQHPAISATTKPITLYFGRGET